MKTSLIDCDVKVISPIDSHKKVWAGHIGQIVNIFLSKHLNPRYTIMFEDNAEGILVNFYGSEFVVLLAGDGNTNVSLKVRKGIGIG